MIFNNKKTYIFMHDAMIYDVLPSKFQGYLQLHHKTVSEECCLSYHKKRAHLCFEYMHKIHQLPWNQDFFHLENKQLPVITSINYILNNKHKEYAFPNFLVFILENYVIMIYNKNIVDHELRSTAKQKNVNIVYKTSPS